MCVIVLKIKIYNLLFFVFHNKKLCNAVSMVLYYRHSSYSNTVQAYWVNVFWYKKYHIQTIEKMEHKKILLSPQVFRK